MSVKLKNKKAVIVGGSRGIGKEIAKSYLAEGAAVWIVSRNQSELEKTQRELFSFGEVHASSLDISEEKLVQNFFESVQKKWGNIDVLVNAAAVYGPIGRLEENNPKEWLNALKVNLYGTFLANHFAIPLMKKNRNGAIINFSGGGEGPYVNFSSYVAAKGGVVRFTETVAEELKDFGIRVNAILPGAVNTKFLTELLSAGPGKAGKENYEQALRQEKKGGESPDKAAKLCVWLASDASKGFTGKVISAVWDKYESFPGKIKEIMGTDVYNFRRIRSKDRGLSWED